MNHRWNLVYILAPLAVLTMPSAHGMGIDPAFGRHRGHTRTAKHRRSGRAASPKRRLALHFAQPR